MVVLCAFKSLLALLLLETLQVQGKVRLFSQKIGAIISQTNYHQGQRLTNNER